MHGDDCRSTSITRRVFRWDMESVDGTSKEERWTHIGWFYR